MNATILPETQSAGSLQRNVRQKYSFYCLVENGTHVRYFGITNQNPSRRLLQHFSDATRKRIDHRINWIRHCVNEGIHIDIRVLKAELEFETACKMEIRYIRFFKTAFNLVNTHRGGDSGYGGLPKSSRDKHKESCLIAKAAEPMVHRKQRSKTMLAAKARLRIERAKASLARWEDELRGKAA